MPSTLPTYSDPTDEERAATTSARVDLMHWGRSDTRISPLGRNPTELVRAYEAGEDRTDTLERS